MIFAATAAPARSNTVAAAISSDPLGTGEREAGPRAAGVPIETRAIDAGRELRGGGPVDVERRQGNTELIVRHRTDALAHAGSSSTVRSRAIARESRDLAVPSRTSSTSAVSPPTGRAGTGTRSPHGPGGESRLSAAINASWSSRARAAVSGDGAASPSETAAARRARPWRRRVDRARFRASFATIFSSHGRKGASGPEPGERVVGLHECLLGRVLRLAAIARDQPGDTEGDLPVPLHQILVRSVVALAGSPCELGVLQWSALHGSFSLHGCLHRGGRMAVPAQRLARPSG